MLDIVFGIPYFLFIMDDGMFAVPYRERSCWASLAAIVLAYGGYLAVLIPRLQASPGQPHFGLLFGCVVGLVVLQIVWQAGLAITAGGTWRLKIDERERLIGMKSDGVALTILTATIGGLWWLAVTHPGWAIDGAIVANVAFLALVLAAATKYVSTIVHFHRAA